MALKSNKAVSSQQVTRHLEDLISSHRAYFSEWRASKFSSVEINIKKNQEAKSASANRQEKK